MSMKSPSPAKSAISAYFSTTSLRRIPIARPPRTTFSRPERAALNPTPRASSVLTFPRTTMRPSVGGRIPAIMRISVDFPAPFAPMMPSVVPCGTTKETSRTASTSRTARSPRPSRVMALLKVGTRSNVVRYVSETFWTLIADGLVDTTGPGTGWISETDNELALPRNEEQGTAPQRAESPRRSTEPQRRRRDLAGDDCVAPAAQDGEQRVQPHDALEALGGVLRVPQHGRQVEPDPQEVRQETGHVPEVHLHGAYEHSHAGRECRDHDEEVDAEHHLPVERLAHGDADREVDGQCRKEPEERGAQGRQRQHELGERDVHQQLAAADDASGAGCHRAGEVVVREQTGDQVREEVRPPVSTRQNDHQDEVDARQQQRVDHEPDLSEHRVRVGRTHVRPRQFGDELPAVPQFAQVRTQPGQAPAMRFVDVDRRGELVVVRASGCHAVEPLRFPMSWSVGDPRRAW